jgi:hypothetical protein
MTDKTLPKPFHVALRRLLAEREEFWTKTGNINWRTVAEALEGVHYETLRKAVARERSPSPKLMEQLADLAHTSPDCFLEYQLHLVRRQFDEREVGIDRATENLRRSLTLDR